MARARKADQFANVRTRRATVQNLVSDTVAFLLVCPPGTAMSRWQGNEL
jgi:hypothetical protein